MAESHKERHNDASERTEPTKTPDKEPGKWGRAKVSQVRTPAMNHICYMFKQKQEEDGNQNKQHDETDQVHQSSAFQGKGVGCSHSCKSDLVGSLTGINPVGARLEFGKIPRKWE